jgi:3-hydroxyisobutyrate dehydrogenase-like beta-hydroxyacid dehydrogenase
MRIAGQTLAEHEAPAPVSTAVQQMVTALVAAGQGKEDYSALATVLFRLAGLSGEITS